MLIRWMACSSSGVTPTIEAIAAGAGYWPPNSQTAIEGSIGAKLPAIELDVALTDDRIPVLHDGPWLSSETCIRADGSPFGETLLVRSLTAEQIAEAFLCGGLPDPARPNALLAEEPIMTLSEAITLLPATPIDSVRLDVFYQDGVTPPPDVIAKNILETWESSDLPQVLSITSNHPDLLEAFDAEAHVRGRDLDLGWYAPSEGQTIEIVTQELDRWSNGLDYAAMAEVVGADLLWLDPKVADIGALRAARAEGLRFGITPADDPRELSFWSRSGLVDRIATRYPGDAGGDL